MILDDEGFCLSPFWDADLTWNTETPVLTPCFEYTALTLIPVLFLWSLSLTLTLKRRSKDFPLPCSCLAVAKYFLTGLLTVLYCSSFVTYIVDNSRIVSPDTVTSDVLKGLTCLLVLIMQIVDSRCGRRSSSVLFTFWFLFLICSLPTYYRLLLMTFQEYSGQLSSLEYFVSVVSFPLIFGELVLSTFCEPKPYDLNNVTPLLKAPPLSLFVFEWFTPLVIKGFRKVMSLSDLFPTLPDLRSDYNWQLWNESLEGEDESNLDTKRKPPSLFWSLARAFWIPVAIASFYEIMFVVLRLFPALILNLIIDFMSNDEETWKGYLYAGAIFVVSTSSTMFIRHGDYIMTLTGLRIKSVLINAVYRKLLRISSTALSSYTVGEIVNVVSVDADKVYQLSMYIAIAVGFPINILIPVFLLWQYLGPSCLAGIAVIVLMMPITVAVARKCSTLQEAQMSLKDDRLKNSGEVLNSIKILKFYAWELPFMKKIKDIRSQEITILTRYAYFSALLRFFWTLTPFLVSLFAFMTYLLVSDQNVLDPATAFVSLTLFNTMRFAISFTPDIISNLVQTTVSLKRIAKLLACEELNEDAIGSTPDKEDVITMSRASFAWNGSKPTLKDIQISVKKGQLIAIVGEVGAGKSSLLSAMLGDMRLLSGKIDLKGSLAYVPQLAWIQNTTVKQNILFTSPSSQKFYNKVVDVCCLGPDIDMLPGGDLTEIGEKGVNLSGGQKQRISLARAVFQDKNIYLLDDPLSAVDAHVGTAIFDNVIGPRGILRRKTRILVTNNLYILPYADYIIVLKHGSILEAGTYNDLEDNRGKLSQLIKEYQQTEEEEEQFERDKERTISEMKTEHFTQSLSSSDTSQYGARGAEFLLITEEGVETGSVKSDVYVKYLKYLGPCMAAMILIGFTGFRVFDMVGGIWLSAWSSDQLLPNGQQDVELRNMRMIVYAIFGILQGVFSFFGTAMLAKGAVIASKKLHDRMLSSLMRAPMSFFDTTPFGRILNRLGKDVDQLDIQLPAVANLFLELLFQVVGMIVLISVNVPVYLAVAVPVLGVFLVIQRVYLATLRQLKRLESVSRSPVFNHFSESVSGLSSIRGYRVQDSFIKRCDERLDATQNCSYLQMVAQRWMTTRLEILGNLLNLSIVGIVVFYREIMDPGTAGLLISYSLNTAYSFNYVIHYCAEVETAVVAAERIDEYTKIPSEAEWSVEPQPRKEWPHSGAVEFQDYCTRYREGLELVLREVNLLINPGEKVGVVGRTGAGKSSLTLSLFRIIEAAGGTILVDNVNVAKIGLHDLRPKLTIIPQDPVLFSGTLRLNLDPGNEYNDEQLWKALDTVNMKDHFKVDGLSTEISEGGQNLSLGQRQLLCLARAILRKTRILILDEATAAVDMETDAFVQETIRKNFAECTVLTIAHRLHTILDSDKVIVMASGKIIENDSPSKLLKDRNSEFYDMAKEAGIV